MKAWTLAMVGPSSEKGPTRMICSRESSFSVVVSFITWPGASGPETPPEQALFQKPPGFPTAKNFQGKMNVVSIDY